VRDSGAIETSSVAAKLPHEKEHLDALQRMQMLEPYYRWVYDLFGEHMGSRVLDAGCGVGNFTSLLAEKAELVVAADLSDQNLEVVRQRFATSTVVEPMQADLDVHVDLLAQRQLDTVVCLDVLEHVEFDTRLLSSFYQIVRPEGRLLLKVPALQWLYGSIDRASDHYRRYARRELRQKVEGAGWRVVHCRHMNLAGVLPYWIKSRVLRKGVNLSRTFSEKQLRQIARSIPALRLLDRLTGPPIGQSLVLIAEKSGSA
jgi:2-polyprenyl-3-methyl-5-hydroxy-6-metoxy-1,4-benzoquinol methylase